MHEVHKRCAWCKGMKWTTEEKEQADGGRCRVMRFDISQSRGCVVGGWIGGRRLTFSSAAGLLR